MNLELRGVTHRYGALTVLEDVSLTVRAGEIVAIVGPSGCGKSTLLRLLGGLERPTHGEALQSGEPGDSLNPSTFVFQDFALLPWRTAEGNVALALEHHNLSPSERARMVAETLDMTGLSAFAKAFPKQLSGGMRQRVGIARALAARPAAMLMDEPLSALDAQTRVLLLDDLIRLWLRSRFTIVYVTHALDEAARLAHRIAVMSRRPGRIREIIDVRTPVETRSENVAEIAALSARLWDLLRNEAEAAERDLQDAIRYPCGKSAFGG